MDKPIDLLRGIHVNGKKKILDTPSLLWMSAISFKETALKAAYSWQAAVVWFTNALFVFLLACQNSPKVSKRTLVALGSYDGSVLWMGYPCIRPLRADYWLQGMALEHCSAAVCRHDDMMTWCQENMFRTPWHVLEKVVSVTSIDPNTYWTDKVLQLQGFPCLSHETWYNSVEPWQSQKVAKKKKKNIRNTQRALQSWWSAWDKTWNPGCSRAS